MHIECIKNNGKPYLRIVHGFYVNENGVGKSKKRIIKNLGPLDKWDDGQPNFLDRFRNGFKNGTILFDGISYKDIEVKRNEKINIEVTNMSLDPKNFGFLFLDHYFDSLGINDVLREVKSDNNTSLDLVGITKLLTFGRILDPQSKKRTFEIKDKYLFPITSSTDLKDVYRTLDFLDLKSSTIQTRINTKIKNSSIGRKTDLMFYDVTNYYFETMYGDEDKEFIDPNTGEVTKDIGLRKKGVSKEKRSEPIVQMGLFIDQNGLPVSYKLYPGNTQDKTTLSDMIKNSINTQEDGKVIVVADNGNNTQENKFLLVDKGNGYIITKSVKQSWKKYRDFILEINKEQKSSISETEYKYVYNSLNQITFKYKSRINKITISDKDGNTKEIEEKEIVFWSKKQYDREEFQNSQFLEYLESCKENPDKLKDKQRKSQEFIKIVQTDKDTGEIIKTTPLVVLLQDKIDKYKETMGYYSIVTSEIALEETEIINRYHGLSRIEDSFRILKSNLESRPVYVWTKEHINAHFLICFIALTTIRLIQYKILKSNGKTSLNVDGWEQGITAKKLQETLENMQSDKLNEEYYKVTKIDEYGENILKAHGLEWFKKIPSLKEIRKFKNDLKCQKI